MKRALLNGWQAIHAAAPAKVGGKAWTLAQLSRYGFPVPPILSIPTWVYDDWLRDSGLSNALLAAAELADSAELERLHAQLLSIPLPLALQAELRQALAELGPQTPLAVRSSSPQEDSARASFAGIHRSFLNVRGEQALLEAVAGVWASLWTPSAVAYRARMGIPQEQAAMSVLVMPLVDAQCSGIGFTCDPVSGRPDRVILHANWGLGESLVGGQAGGDEIILQSTPADASLTLLEYRSGRKETRTLAQESGGTRQVPSAAGRDALTLAQATELGELLYQVALALNLEEPAYDCEWAWDGQQFWVVQARPVTVKGKNTYPELSNQPVLWSRGNTRDVMPFAVMPLEWSLVQATAPLIPREGLRQAGFDVQAGVPLFTLKHGHLYLNMSVLQWELSAAYGVPVEDTNALIGGEQGVIRVPAPGLSERLAQGRRMLRFILRNTRLRQQGKRDAADLMAWVRARQAEALPDDAAGLARWLRDLSAHTTQQHHLFFMQGAGGASLWALVKLLDKYLRGEGHALASALMAGGPPSVTAQQGYDLIRVAHTLREDTQARELLEVEPLGWRKLPESSPFRQTFTAYLEQYGHRANYESYLREPRWNENPQYLLQQLPDLMNLNVTPARPQSHAATLSRALKAVPWTQRSRLKLLLKLSHDESNDRELARSALFAPLTLSRRMLLHLGGQWQARGWLEGPQDILFLLAPEILSVLDGQRGGASLPPLITDRRAQFAVWEGLNVPEVIVEGQEGTPFAQQNPPSPAPTGATRTFKGVCVGTGQVTGRACVLHSPHEQAKMKPGDILVVPSTDPSWTPLFLKAGGLVMETGGFLSHGAIVAREFGLPAVVNVTGILSQVQDGQMLHVDAAAGTVNLLEKETRS